MLPLFSNLNFNGMLVVIDMLAVVPTSSGGDLSAHLHSECYDAIISNDASFSLFSTAHTLY